MEDVYKKFGASKENKKKKTENSGYTGDLFGGQTAIATKNEEGLKNWCFGYRCIARNTDFRTVISCIFPLSGVGHSMAILWQLSIYDALLLNANLSSIVLDYSARCKIGGTNISQFYFKQLPIIAPEQYSQKEKDFVVAYSKKLLGTSHKMAEILGCPVTVWDTDQRAVLTARLDAFYAIKYGLSREDFEFILDPEAVMGQGYPTETFPQVKSNDIRDYGEYRTKRLALQAYDELKENGLWNL